MTVGLPTIDNVVLAVSLEKLFEAKEKDEGKICMFCVVFLFVWLIVMYVL